VVDDERFEVVLADPVSVALWLRSWQNDRSQTASADQRDHRPLGRVSESVGDLPHREQLDAGQP
jgi:hypothetical protein